MFILYYYIIYYIIIIIINYNYIFCIGYYYIIYYYIINYYVIAEKWNTFSLQQVLSVEAFQNGYQPLVNL